MSLSLLILEPLFQSSLSCAVVMQSTFMSVFETTAMPSFATWTSV